MGSPSTCVIAEQSFHILNDSLSLQLFSKLWLSCLPYQEPQAFYTKYAEQQRNEAIVPLRITLSPIILLLLIIAQTHMVVHV